MSKAFAALCSLSGFLNLSTSDIWGWLSLYCGDWCGALLGVKQCLKLRGLMTSIKFSVTSQLQNSYFSEFGLLSMSFPFSWMVPCSHKITNICPLHFSVLVFGSASAGWTNFFCSITHPWFYSLDASNIPPTPSCDNQMSPDITKYPLRCEIVPG